MADSDEDTPPPLSSLSDQLHAVQLSNSMTGTAGLKERELKVAATTPAVSAMPNTAMPAVKPFKRGFLDSKPRKQQTTAQIRAPSEQKAAMITAKPAQHHGQHIPEMFKIEPSEEQKRYSMMKSKLLDVLAPTPDTISAIGSNPVLAAGFEDPEVMRAVSEVASNPAAIKKYANNPKVQQFYTAFGGLMGSKLEALGSHTNAPSHSSGSRFRPSGVEEANSKREFLA